MANKSATSKQMKKLAPAALWISGTATVVLMVLLFTKLVAYIGLYTPTNTKPINLALWISLAVAVIGVAIYALMDPKNVQAFMSGRQARHGSNAVIMIVAFSLILVVVNVIAFQNPLQRDWTEDKTNSLAPETIHALQALPTPVHAIGFYTSSMSRGSADEILSNAEGKSNGKFTYEFVDPTSNPVRAEQFKVAQDGTIVLTMGDRQQSFTTMDEQHFTNALVNLMNPGQRAVYFLTGHGEHSTETAGQKAYTQAKYLLESKNYTVKTLNLLAQNKIPDDALAIIIGGPTQPLSTEEMNLLKSYLGKGGSLVVLEDPDLSQKTQSPVRSDALEGYLAASWDIQVDNDLVLDPNSTQAVVAWANSYGSHVITGSLNSQGLATFFPTASSLTLNSTNAQVQTTALVKTIENAWGETNFAAMQSNQVAQDAKDIAGPLILAATAENSNGKGKVVVFGDSDFATDSYLNQYGNVDMFVNSVDWACGEQDLIGLTAKQPVTRSMAAPNAFTLFGLAFLFLIGLPGLFFTAGISFWLAGQMWFMRWSVATRILSSALLFGILGVVLDLVLKFTPSVVLLMGVLFAFLGGGVYGLLLGGLSSWIVQLRHG